MRKLRSLCTRARVTTALDLAGAAAITTGVGMWSPPAGWVTGGVLTILFSVLQALQSRPAKASARATEGAR